MQNDPLLAYLTYIRLFFRILQQFMQAYKDHLGGEVKLPMSDRRALNRLTSIDWETERLLSRNKDLLRNPKSRLVYQI